MNLLNHTTFRTVAILTLFAVALNIGRALTLHRFSEMYLTWNLVLAVIPIAISSFLVWYGKQSKPIVFIVIFGFLIWLAVFPNAPYLLTDFIHLRNGATVPIWYNILMFFAAAWAGLIAAFYSLSQIEEMLRRYFKAPLIWLIVSISLILTGFGIYIGRFLRWNSWDLFVNPRELSNDIWTVLFQPSNHPDAFFFTAIFFVFMIVSYVAWRTGGNQYTSVPVKE